MRLLALVACLALARVGVSADGERMAAEPFNGAVHSDPGADVVDVDDGGVLNRFGEIDPLRVVAHGVDLFSAHSSAPVHSQMPLPNAGSSVALALE